MIPAIATIATISTKPPKVPITLVSRGALQQPRADDREQKVRRPRADRRNHVAAREAGVDGRDYARDHEVDEDDRDREPKAEPGAASAARRAQSQRHRDQGEDERREWARQLLFVRRLEGARLLRTELPRTDYREDFGAAHLLAILVGDRLLDLARFLADVDLLFRRLRQVRRMVRIETVFLRVAKRPRWHLVFRTFGEDDHLRLILSVVLYDGDVQQRLRRRIITAEERHLLPAARQARGHRVAAAAERAHMLDHLFAQIRRPVVGERNHAFLQRQRDERDAQTDQQERRDRANEADPAGLHRGDLALAGESLQREQDAEQHRHRNDGDHDLR